MSVTSATRTFQNAPEDDRFQWTVDSFYRALDAAVFDEPNRYELIEGDLWSKDLKPAHASVARRALRLFLQHFRRRSMR